MDYFSKSMKPPKGLRQLDKKRGKSAPQRADFSNTN